MEKPARGVRRTLTDATSILDRLGLRYAVVGGLAVGAWGVSRSTDDVDIFAELPQKRRAALKRALEKEGFDVPAMDDELRQFGVFRSKSGGDTFLDIFDSAGPLGDAVLERRRPVGVGKRKVWFVAPEELIVLKAFSERERDFEDVAALLSVVMDTIDLAYVRRWAARLDGSTGGNEVTLRLERAIASKPAPKRRRRTP